MLSFSPNPRDLHTLYNVIRKDETYNTRKQIARPNTRVRTTMHENYWIPKNVAFIQIMAKIARSSG